MPANIDAVYSPHNNQYRYGLILVISATVAWSTAGLFTRLLPHDSWTLLVWRGFFGAIGIAVFSLIIDRRQSLSGIRNLGFYGWAFVVVSAVGMVLLITAFRFTTVAHVSIIYATVPLVTATIAWLVLREKPDDKAITASVAAVVGVAVMVSINSDGHWLGDLLAFGMTACLAGMMIITRLSPDIPVLPAAGMSALLSAAIALPLSQPLSIEPNQWGFLILFGVVNSALGLSLFVVGAKHLPAIDTALITALDAPLAPIWVWIFFNETMGASTMTGGLIVFIAVAMYLHSSNSTRCSAEEQ